MSKTHKFILSGTDPAEKAALAEMTHTYGENGAYRATEELARKVMSNGPGWFYGDGHCSPPPPLPTPSKVIAAMRSVVCPVCDSGSMTMKHDGRCICRRCRHEWRRPQ